MDLETDEENLVLYRTMGVEDVPAVLDAVAGAFHEGEPVSAASRPACTLQDWRSFTEMFLPRMAAEGLTVVAFDKTTGKAAQRDVTSDVDHSAKQGYRHTWSQLQNHNQPILFQKNSTR